MWNVVRFEVSRALKKKSFWVASIIPPLVVLAVFGIEYFSIRTSQSMNAQQAFTASSTKVAAFDASGLVSKSMLTAAHLSSEPTKEAGIADVVAGKLDAFIYYPPDVASSEIQIYSQAKGIGQTPYNNLATNLLKESVVAKVSAAASGGQAVQILQNTPSVSVTTYKNGVQTPGFAALIAPGLFALAFILLIILLSPFMISSTGEEKENRAAEILLTSIKARALIGGKAISIFVLGIVQSVVIIVPVLLVALRFPALLPAGISLSHIPLDPLSILIGVLFLAGGFTLFTGLMMGAGSMIPGTNAANRFIGVFIIWVFVPIYMISLIISAPHNIAVTIFTYFPLTAPTTVLLRNALGNLSLGETAIAFVIVVATAVFAIWFAMRAFRYGSMEHGRRIKIKELL